MAVVATIECPYCTSPVTVIARGDRISVDHHQVWADQCEPRLRKLLADFAKEEGFTPIFARDN